MDITDNEIKLAVANLRIQNQIVEKQLLGLLGTTIDGKSVWGPDSYQRGFVYELTPEGERPKLVWDLGIFSMYADGHLNYVPSFNEGRAKARDLKTNLIAQYAINMKKEFTQKIKSQDDEISELKKRLSELEKGKKDKSP